MKTRARKVTRKSPAFTLVVEDEGWRKDPATLKLVRRAARLALDHPPRRTRSVTLLLSGDKRVRELNHQFRGRKAATNVLSFLSDDPCYWGDVAIALGVVRKEAKAQGKSVAAHAAHLTVHGILHLKGYDHSQAADQASMEAVEILILSRLGVADPYAPIPIRDPQNR